jgi:hypothetical protein
VDFGIDSPVNLNDLVDQLRRQGPTEIQERSRDTVHLLWNGSKVSAFVLDFLNRSTRDRGGRPVGESGRCPPDLAIFIRPGRRAAGPA